MNPPLMYTQDEENLTGYQKNLGNPSFTATPSTSQHELDNIG